MWSGYICNWNFRPFLSLVPQKMCRKAQIWPIPQSQNCIKIAKINRPWPKSYPFWRWWGYISMQILVQSFRVCSRKSTETPNLTNLTKFLACVTFKFHDLEKNKHLVLPHKVNVFCKFHEIWVKILGDTAPRIVTKKWTDRRMDRQTWSVYRAACHS